MKNAASYRNGYQAPARGFNKSGKLGKPALCWFCAGVRCSCDGHLGIHKQSASYGLCEECYKNTQVAVKNPKLALGRNGQRTKTLIRLMKSVAGGNGHPDFALAGKS